jgi:TetR/AcrR family transcriptional regulator, transcriptional repressor for nem operon
MSKADRTKENIIKQAAELFNQKGYAGSSISDVMNATGLKKGGIYNHFKSKDELALEAFEYAQGIVSQLIWQAVRRKKGAKERLKALFSLYLTYFDNPPLKGGCPILNTAIESDDTNPVLRDRVRAAIDEWRDLICRILKKGIAKGEIKPTVEPDVIATIVISNLEGAVMMTQLYQNPIYLKRVVEHLQNYLDSCL